MATRTKSLEEALEKAMADIEAERPKEAPRAALQLPQGCVDQLTFLTAEVERINGIDAPMRLTAALDELIRYAERLRQAAATRARAKASERRANGR